MFSISPRATDFTNQINDAPGPGYYEINNSIKTAKTVNITMHKNKVTYKRMIKKYNKGFEPKSYKDFVISIVEKLCKQLNYERFKIYNMPYLLTRIKYKMVSDKNNVYYDFIKNIKVDFE